MVDQYAEVSTVQMQMNYDPNLNFAPPNYNQNTFNQPISSQTYIPQSPYGQQNYGQQNYGQQNYGQNNTGNNFYPNQQSPIYSPNLYGQTQQQDQFAPTISANGNNFAPSYNPPPVYGSQPY